MTQQEQLKADKKILEDKGELFYYITDIHDCYRVLLDIDELLEAQKRITQFEERERAVEIIESFRCQCGCGYIVSDTQPEDIIKAIN